MAHRLLTLTDGVRVEYQNGGTMRNGLVASSILVLTLSSAVNTEAADWRWSRPNSAPVTAAVETPNQPTFWTQLADIEVDGTPAIAADYGNDLQSAIAAAIEREMARTTPERARATSLLQQQAAVSHSSWRSRHPALLGALIGAGAGALVAYGIAASGGLGEPGLWAPVGAGIGAGAGAVVGLLAGR